MVAVKKRDEMILETRSKLIAAGRLAFATKGYADASMDDFTAEVGLTRGALYHHFGGKKGLLEAVIAQIDEEMSERLDAVTHHADTLWRGFVDESVAYLQMALEPEIQRIMLLDGPAVLGDPSQWAIKNSCLSATISSLEKLIEEKVIHPVNTEATARLVNGATLYAALWIAGADDPKATSKQAIDSFVTLVNGLLISPPASN